MWVNSLNHVKDINHIHTLDPCAASGQAVAPRWERPKFPFLKINVDASVKALAVLLGTALVAS
ncbi:uncharacterized protein G2W53_005999 [Senna tora]|uniref:Uncharacterized protein n=1 Tax=Senna tora TaxID=362788 RepID=A0A834X371_9FABA|nr:uncharacterized protein G2W53_005999 [Senna tora]